MTPDTNAPPAPATSTAAQPRLRRVLGLGDLIFYGIVLIQPVGAVGIFGLKSLEHELNRCLDHLGPLLRETARQAKLRLQRS